MKALLLLSTPGLWLLTGLVPLVLLYVMKMRRERVRVSSSWLWGAAERNLLARHPWRRLTRELPLLLEALALTALAIALSRPATRGGALAEDHVAIVIDTSASMLTRATGDPQGTTTRFDEAKRVALAAVTHLAPGADAFVVDSGRQGRAVTPPERDSRALGEAIARMEAHEVEGDLASGLGLAADRLRGLHGSRRIVVITDGALAHDARLSTGGIATEIITVGEDADNTAIVRVDVRRGTEPSTKRDEVQVFAMIETFGGAGEAYVTLSFAGGAEPIASRRLTLPAHAKTPVVLSFVPTSEDEGRGIVVRVAPGDAFPADDVAYGRVPGGRALPVVLATDRPSSWVGRALAADVDVNLRTIAVGDLARIDVDPDALVVLDGGCPASFPGRDVLVIDPGEGDCLGVKIGAVIDQPRVTSWEAGDARLRFLTFDGVHIAHARALDAEGARAALVHGETTPLVVDASAPGRTATLVGFDLADSDWPVQTSFVLFVRNVVELARAHRAGGGTLPARTGEPIRFAVPTAVALVHAEVPGVAPMDIGVHDGFAALPVPLQSGIVELRWVEPHVGRALIPVNLTSEAESDIRPRAVEIDAGGDVTTTTTRAVEAHHEWSPLLALLAAAAMTWELFWLTRTGRSRAAEGRSPWPPAIVAVAFAPLAYEVLVRAHALSDRFLRFGSPVALVAFAAAGTVLAFRLARLPPRMTPTRRGAFAALSSFAVLAAALAVAEPEVGTPLDRTTVLVAVDRSRSIDLVPDAEARIRTELALAEKSMRSGDRIGTVVFGAEAAVEDPPRPRSDLAPPQRIDVGRDGTDLEAAIRRALEEVPPDSAARVVLVTDGVETRGDALAASAAAQAAGVPIDAVVLDQKLAHDVRVVGLGAPSRADRGEPFDLRVITSSAIGTDLEVRLTRDGVPLATVARAHVNAGGDVLRLREIAPDAGLHRYDVAVTALDPSADSSPDDNTGSAFVKVRGAAIALVLEGDAGAGAPLVRALEAAGFLVAERTTAGVPADPGELAAYDLVTLADIRASDLATSQITALASYVRDLGGGLLLFGSDRAMGPGGYARTPLEDVSPVSFDLKKDERRASLAEVIAIDYSGSMGTVVGGQTKLALANEAAARSASLLGHGDRLGIEHVDTTVRWTVPIAAVDDPDVIGAHIRSVSVGGGGIYTDLALNAGYEALSGETVNLKHLLLFADGDDAEQIAGCRAIVHRAASRGTTTSVISLGHGHDSAELEALSKEGGGRFYLIDDASKLPAVFTQETILATRSAIHEDPFHVSVAAPSPATRGIDFSAAPPLGGYVVTVPKPLATVALTGPDGDPILATWSAGLGRAGAFMSDDRDKWGSGWLGWAGSAKLMGQVARDLARRGEDPRVRLASDASGGELHVRADVVGEDGRAQTFRRLRVRVAGPDGFARDVPLEATGAGRYAASIPLSRPGTYVATALDETTGSSLGTTGAVLDRGQELRPSGSDRALLKQVTLMTGGRMRETLAGLFDDRSARRFSYTPLAPTLTLLAGLALVLSVAARKLVLPAPRSRASTANAPAHRPEATSPTAVPHPTAAPPASATPSAPPTPSAAPSAPAPEPLTSAERLARRRRERR